MNHGYPNSGYPGQGYSEYPPQGQPGYPTQGPGMGGQVPYPTGSIGFVVPGQGGPPGVGFGQESGYLSYPQRPGYDQPSGYPQQPGYIQPLGYAQATGYQLYQPNTGATEHPQRTSIYPGIEMTNSRMQGSSAMSYGRPSIHPAPNFNANADAETLRKAMKGFGCDKGKVIGVLCARSNLQRQEIVKAFKVMYGKDLISDLKSELSGDFEDLILALMQPSAMYDAEQLRKAMQGLGTTESVLIEIMCSRTNAQIAELRSVYRQLYHKELENDLIGETSGHFKRLLVSLCAGGRDESHHMDPLKANQDARALYRAGEQRLGTDESCFNAILASQNFAQLRLVFEEYQKVSNHTIEQAIQAEFSGDIRDGLLALVKCIQNRPAFFAEALYHSMKGLGTRDNDLIRAVVTRAEVDMADIREEFQRMYKTSLEAMIKGDCSGSYKDGLIALVRGNM
ncbi:hypothetical protein L596_024468 [Steinernema carpocapsae]|nr:hypothetical protein L596_024468 [Steinernema carpocapsae]